jgi:hypothetical protein
MRYFPTQHISERAEMFLLSADPAWLAYSVDMVQSITTNRPSRQLYALHCGSTAA